MKSCYLVIYWTKIKLGDIHCIHVKIRDTEVELPKQWFGLLNHYMISIVFKIPMCNIPGFNSTSQKIKKYVSDKLFSLFENHEKRIIVIQIKIYRYVHVYLPKSYGQSSLVPKTKSRPRICETSTPEVMASWLKTPANPLNEVGAISERYRGAAPEFIPAKENLKR